MIDFAKLDQTPESVITELCRIDLSDLMRTMEQHPALFGYAAACHERAKIHEIQAKAEAERTKAQVFLDLAAKDPSKAANRLERETEAHPEYRKALAVYHGALQRAGSLKALTIAMEHRRDMIVQIASRQKREMSNT